MNDFTCAICWREFRTYNNFKQHARVKHPNEEQRFHFIGSDYE